MITVHWSTHDLDAYYAQIKQIPYLSKEEQHQLVTLLAHCEQGQSMSTLDTLQTARRRLIEGHLRRAAAVAIRECPPWRYRLLPELVEAAPERDPALRAQIERWLAWLTPRAQAVLRLRYGLSDEDERAHSATEVARLLGLPLDAVQQTERNALRRLRALLSEEACLNGTDEQPRRRRRRPHTRRSASTEVPAEQEAHLLQTATRLQAQGLGVTLRRLTQESGVPAYRVQAFLKAHRDQFPAVTAADKHQQALAQVARVYTQLVARGEAVTSSKKLAKAAHVRIDTVLEFLHAARSKQDAIA